MLATVAGRPEAERRRLVLWLPVLFGCGIALYFAASGEPPLWLVVVSGVVALALLGVAVRLRGAALGLSLVLAMLAGGHATAALRARLVAAPVLPAPVTALVEGRLVGLSQSAAGRPRLLLDAVTVYGMAPEASPERVRVTLRRMAGAEGLAPGDWLSVMADLMPPGPPVAPGAFDFARAAWFERLGAVGTARGAVAPVALERPDTVLEALGFRWARLRAALSAGLRARIPGEAGAFAAAIVTGDRSALPPLAVAALRDSNLAHLLAISGLHMAMVSGLVFAATRLALVLVPRVALIWPVKRIAAVAALVAAVSYLALSGAAVATQRAFLMAAVALGGIVADRPAIALRGLAAAAFAILLLAPESLLSVGFQMSFSATLALVALYDGARRRGWLAPVSGWRRRWVRAVLALAMTSAVAGLATAPFAAFHFNRTAPFGLVANLAAVPAMGLVVAPMLALAGALAPFGLEALPLAAAAAGIEWILAVARTVAAWPGAVRAVPSPVAPVLPLIAAGGLWLCLWSGGWRVLGLGPVAAGLVVWALVLGPRPDLLIAPHGAAVAVRGPEGLVPDHPALGGYAVETWLRREGDGAGQRAAAERAAWRAADGWLSAPLPDGGSVHVARWRRPPRAAVAARCTADAVIVVQTLRLGEAGLGEAGPCRIVDRTALDRGHAMLAGGRAEGGVTLMPVGEGARPWRRAAWP